MNNKVAENNGRMVVLTLVLVEFMELLNKTGIDDLSYMDSVSLVRFVREFDENRRR